MIHIKLNPNKGQILIEAMVAMSVATVGLLGAFTLLSFSLRLNRDVNDKFIAVSLATEGLEIVKNLLRHNAITTNPWNAGNCLLEGSHEMDWNEDGGEGGSSECLFEDKYLKFESDPGSPNFGIYSYDEGEDSKYQREITLVLYCLGFPCTPSDTVNEIQVNSIVRWAGIGGVEYEINLEDHFFNWLTQCNDGLDNDNDLGGGLGTGIDQADDNCSASTDTFEG